MRRHALLILVGLAVVAGLVSAALPTLRGLAGAGADEVPLYDVASEDFIRRDIASNSSGWNTRPMSASSGRDSWCCTGVVMPITRLVCIASTMELNSG